MVPHHAIDTLSIKKLVAECKTRGEVDLTKAITHRFQLIYLICALQFAEPTVNLCDDVTVAAAMSDRRLVKPGRARLVQERKEHLAGIRANPRIPQEVVDNEV